MTIWWVCCEQMSTWSSDEIAELLFTLEQIQYLIDGFGYSLLQSLSCWILISQHVFTGG